MIFLLMMTISSDIPLHDKNPHFELYNTSGMELPIDKNEIDKVLQLIENQEKVKFSLAEIVFVSEQEIQKINREHLSRDYVTDVISFRYDEDDDQGIEGTLYCCAPRISEQSREYKTEEREEFLRVVIHGLLHLTGYNDETEEEKTEMTALENRYLSHL